jgi:hypothetical protein
MALSSWAVIPNNLQARFTAVAKKVRADFEESAHTIEVHAERSAKRYWLNFGTVYARNG